MVRPPVMFPRGFSVVSFLIRSPRMSACRWKVTSIFRPCIRKSLVIKGHQGSRRAEGNFSLLRHCNWVSSTRNDRKSSKTSLRLEIFIWAVPVLIPSAIAISLVGLVLGPMYPIMMNQCGNFIPAHILSGAIGWICSFGMVGTAAVPLLTGILADAKGVSTLQPL